MARCKLLSGAPRSLHAIKRLLSKTHISQSSSAVQEFWFCLKKKGTNGEVPCPGFAGNWQVLKSKVSYAEQPHPQPSMCSCTSPGSTLTRWPVLCPSLLSFRLYLAKFCPAFGIKAQPLELPPVLRTVHLLETATTRGATALCCQWALLTQGDRRDQPAGKLGKFGPNACQPTRIK